MAPRMAPATVLPLWYQALEHEFGIRVEVPPEDKHFFVNLLYEARKEQIDPELDKIIVCQPSPTPNEIWLVKKETEL